MIQKLISNVINNNFNALQKKCGLSKTQSKNLKLLGGEILKKGSLVLRKLTPCSGDKTTKEQGKVFGNTLESVNIKKSIEQKILKNFSKKITKNTVIGYDLTDEIHPYADIDKVNGMENISKIFDGSRRRKENGYFLHGVGTDKHLLRLETHKTGYEFLPQKRKNILEEILPELQNKGIWAFDRGNDDEKLFSYLSAKNVKFIVRLKKIRQFCFSKTGEVFNYEDIPVGRHTVFIRKSGKSYFDNKIEYLLIKKQHLENKNPILLLCSMNLEGFSDTNLVEKYLKRWGVETQFRKIKQIYQLEKIQIRKWKRRKNLLALLLFMHFLSTQIEQKLEEGKKDTKEKALLVWERIKLFLHKKSKDYNFYSFMEFLRTQIPKNFFFYLRVKTHKTSINTAISLF